MVRSEVLYHPEDREPSCSGGFSWARRQRVCLGLRCRRTPEDRSTPCHRYLISDQKKTPKISPAKRLFKSLKMHQTIFAARLESSDTWYDSSENSWFRVSMSTRVTAGRFKTGSNRCASIGKKEFRDCLWSFNPTRCGRANGRNE